VERVSAGKRVRRDRNILARELTEVRRMPPLPRQSGRFAYLLITIARATISAGQLRRWAAHDVD